MKSVIFPAYLLALLALSIFTSGCSNLGANDQKPAAATSSQAPTSCGHDHDDGGHDHDGHDGADHDNRDRCAEHEGPHRGHVIDLGHNHLYHAELVENEDVNGVTVFILDQDMKELAIDQAALSVNLMVDGQVQSFELTAAGAAAGTASQFNAADSALLEALHEHETSGKLRVTIDGTPYSGAVEHYHHDSRDDDH